MRPLILVLLAAACGSSPDSAPAAQPATPLPATPTAGASAEVMCALLTQAEAEAILGKAPVAPEPQPNGSCSYSSGDIMIAMLPKEFGSVKEFTDFARAEVKRTNERAKMDVMSYEAVSLGDAAFYDGFSVHILRGGRVLTIVADKSRALAVAGKALPRWKSTGG
ncbi:MAG TPA: hypothetical protein VJ817_01980 [Gemmatimonadales bacterium]|nr:hypothetical protein [Gemmatimonadales bacterium]